MIRLRLAGLAAGLALGCIAGPASAGAILPGPAWTFFCFGAAGSEASDSCAPGFAAASPYFTIAGGTTTTIEVTDAFLPGDSFRIELNNGSETFFSSVPDLTAPGEDDPERAFRSGRFSRALITLDPGFNEFRIFAEASPFGAGAGFVRVVSAPSIGVPAPAAFALFGLALAGLLTARRR
jgi:hypothetical protein